MNMEDFGKKFMKEILRDDLKKAMLKRDLAKRDTIRIILGELSREKDKHVDNFRIVSIVKRLIKDEKEGHNDQVFISICSEYIPVELKDAT